MTQTMSQTKMCLAVQPPRPCPVKGDWSRRLYMQASEKVPYYEALLHSHQDEAKYHLIKLCGEDFSPELFLGMISNAKEISRLISEYNGKERPIPEHLLREKINEVKKAFERFEDKKVIASWSEKERCPVEALALATFVHATTSRATSIVGACDRVEDAWVQNGGKVDESYAKGLSANTDALSSKIAGMMMLGEAKLDPSMDIVPVILIPDAPAVK